MPGLFSSFKHLYRLCKEKLGVCSKGIPCSGSLASTLDPRPSTQPSHIQVSSFKSHPLPPVLRQLPAASSQLPRLPRLPLGLRITATVLSILLFLTSSPPLLAITMGQIRAGSATPGSGGQGSFSNLQNAGAASAELTAAMAQGNLKKANDIIVAMRNLQKQASDFAKANPSTVLPKDINGIQQTVNGSSAVQNGLKAGWLEPYVGKNVDGSLKSGFDGSGNPITDPINGGTWSGASITSVDLTKNPTAAKDPNYIANTANYVNITQSQQNAYLYWNKFNVGPLTTVNFDQSAGGKDVANWVAFNKVMSASDPSHIFGTINAQGQVYILNQNGILFHNGSVVNTRALVASALPINPGLSGIPKEGTSVQVSKGLVNISKSNPDFLFDTSFGNSGGNVTVELGATINSTEASDSGGKIALIGKNVMNNGTLKAQNGQIIMAAGNQIGMAPHFSSDSTLRGLDIFVGDSDNNAGSVINGNTGIIDSMLSSVTLVGKSVEQSGAIISTTSVSLDGRVDLLAEYQSIPNSSGSINAPLRVPTKSGPVSISGLTVVTPETQSKESAPGQQLTLPSLISIAGNSISLSSSGVILAPGARIGSGLGVAIPQNMDGSTMTEGVMLRADSGIEIGTGAILSAAGSTGIEAPMNENFLTVQLRGGELADSPLQQNNFNIRGKDIVIDARQTGVYNGNYWIGTPLGDATGFLNLIQRTVGELTVQGGSISLVSKNNKISIAEGAEIDVSGGWLHYAGGYFSTSKIMSDSGQIFDISQALPDRVYKEIITSSKTYQPGYISGANAGFLTINAPSLQIYGNLYGRSVVGLYQASAYGQPNSKDQTPMPGSLTLFSNDKNILFCKSGEKISPSADGSLLLSADLMNSQGFGNLTIIDYSATVNVPKDVILMPQTSSQINEGGTTKPTSSFFVSSANINLDGSIIIPGGKISLNAFTVTPADDQKNSNAADAVPLSATADGSIIIGTTPDAHPLLTTAGKITIQNSPNEEITITDGGSCVDPSSGKHLAGIEIAGFRTTIASSATIDVSGGVFLPNSGKSIYGNAGYLSISSGSVPINGYHNDVPFINNPSGGQVPIKLASPNSGELKLDLQNGLDIRGFSGNGISGTLSLSSPLIQIGGNIQNKDTLLLNEKLFNSYGFSQFILNGIGESKSGVPGEYIPAIKIVSGTDIEPKVMNYVVRKNPTTGEISLVPILYAKGERNPASLLLNATGYSDSNDTANGSKRFIRGDVIIETDASITTDPWNSAVVNKLTVINPSRDNNSISIVGDTITIQGTLSSPGGNISITSSTDSTKSFPYVFFPFSATAPLSTLLLGDGALISTAGSDLGAVGKLGQITHPYLNGGSIQLSGNLALGKCILDASGLSAMSDIFSPQSISTKASSFSYSFKKTLVEGTGGNISLKGGQMLFSQANLESFSGGSSGYGGSLMVSSGVFVPATIKQIPKLNIPGYYMDQDGISILALTVANNNFEINDPIAIGTPIRDISGDFLRNGYFSISDFSKGGFDSLNLNGNIGFVGNINILAKQQVSIATSGYVTANGSVLVDAPYVKIGTPYGGPVAINPNDVNNSQLDNSLTSFLYDLDQKAPVYVKPTYGDGSLTIKSSEIDVGNVLLQGIKHLQLLSGSGEIRGYGTITATGTVTLQAGVIDPPTDMSFSVIVYNHDLNGNAVNSDGPGISGGLLELIPHVDSAIPHLPLAAGGSINFFAKEIDINQGVSSDFNQTTSILAPFGTIQIGSNGRPNLIQADGVKFAFPDLISGMNVPATSILNIGKNSLLSVSGLDPTTGEPIAIPYGRSTDGKNWIDPTGRDISSGSGVPKAGIVTSASFSQDNGAIYDLRAGGTLIYYQWLLGNGGDRNALDATTLTWNPNNIYVPGDLVKFAGQTWSARSRNIGQAPPSSSSGATLCWSLVQQSFAILPSYSSLFAPLASFNNVNNQDRLSLANTALSENLGFDAGFVGSFQNGNTFFDYGTGVKYTLLPSLYALLPGAKLIYKNNGSYIAPRKLSDGSVVVNGIIINSLNHSVEIPDTSSQFLSFSDKPLSQLAQYSVFASNPQPSFSFLTPYSLLPKSPGKNSGNLQVSGTLALDFSGRILGAALNGIAASVDLAAPVMTINAAFVQKIMPDSAGASQIGSLLLGGTRRESDAGDGSVVIDVVSSSIDVSAVDLILADLMLVSKDSIVLENGVSIEAAGSGVAPSRQIILNGPGSFFRISDDSNVALKRTLGAVRDLGALTLGDVVLKGSSLILDASSSMQVSSSAKLNALSFGLSAGSLDLVLDPTKEPHNLPKTLVIANNLLDSLLAAKTLNITSYSMLDIYGSGSFEADSMKSLSFHAGEIRGFNLDGGTAAFTAQTISLDNSPGSSSAGPVTDTVNGYLELDAATILLGQNALAIDQFGGVSLNATGVIAGTSSGSLTVGNPDMPADLFLTAPLITATARNSLTATASGNIVLQAPDSGYGTTTTINPGAGGSLSFTGSSVSVDTIITAPSGQITLHATAPSTASNGDVNVGGSGQAQLDVSGVTKSIQSATTTADAGTISIQSDNGKVSLGAGASLNLSASGSSSAGTLNITAPAGVLMVDQGAKLNAVGGSSGGVSGSFALDVSSLDPSGQDHSLLSSIIPQLSPDEKGLGGFTKSLSFRIRTGNVSVDTYIKSASFSLTADQGSINVTQNGVVDATGITGGSISLQASGSIILEPNSLLDVHGDTYDHAGKGGSVLLSAGAETSGQINHDASLNLQTGSAIDLGVTAAPSSIQDLGGVLHLRAPITQDGSDIQIAAMDSTIDPLSSTYTSVAGDTIATAAGQLGISIAQLESANNLSPASVLSPGTTLKSVGSGASSIEVEGYQLYEVSGSTADMALATPLNVQGNAYSGGLTVQQQALADAQSFFGMAGDTSGTTPAVATISRLTGNQPSSIAAVVNLAPGVEIINQSGDLTLSQDWDFSTWRFGKQGSKNADFMGTAGAPGFLTLRAARDININASISDGFTSSKYEAGLLFQNTALPKNFQSWSYKIAAGSDMISADTLQNYYHAGSLFLGKIPEKQRDLLLNAEDIKYNPSNPNDDYFQVVRTGTGDISISCSKDLIFNSELSSIYTTGVACNKLQGSSYNSPILFGNISRNDNQLNVDYTFAGGNINLTTQGKIYYNTISTLGLPLQISNQLPNNWIQRYQANDGSISWWVDFSNFHQSVGALGGGNINITTLEGMDNVDVSIASNFRCNLNISKNLLLGGGDLAIKSNGDILGGVYYVEKGAIDIYSNESIGVASNGRNLDANNKYLMPMSILLGDTVCKIASNGDLTIGSIANLFSLAQGLPYLPEGSSSLSQWAAHYQSANILFSTYSSRTSVSLETFNGNINFLESSKTSKSLSPNDPSIFDWVNNIQVVESGINPTDITYLGRAWVAAVRPGILQAAAILPPRIAMESFNGDVNLAAGSFISGNLTGGAALAPSTSGNLSIMAGKSVNGLILNSQNYVYSQLNLSDADPVRYLGSDRISEGIAPYLFSQDDIDALADSGSTQGAYQILHIRNLLHGMTDATANDQPAIIFAGNGDISGITFISRKNSIIKASGDITDVAFYIQNSSPEDITVVSAGKNITLNNPNSSLRLATKDSTGTLLAPAISLPGDIQISGPGTLEISAGGSISLGSSSPGYNGDDTLGRGITSIGNLRNPFMKPVGADLIILAGANGLNVLNTDKILSAALLSTDSMRYFDDVRNMLTQMGNNGLYEPFSSAVSWSDIISSDKITTEQKKLISVVLFNVILRDSGRDHSDVTRFTDSVLEGPDGSMFIGLIKLNLDIFGLPAGFNVTKESLSSHSTVLTADQKNYLGYALYSTVQQLKGKDYVDKYSNGYKSYDAGEAAIVNLLSDPVSGNITTASRDVRSSAGGSITMLAPGGALALQTTQLRDNSQGLAKPPPGIVTEKGGSISIYTRQSVNLGISRIFTLYGGDIMIWSDKGDVAAGSSKKTVVSAPPTTVSVDSQSGAVKANLGGLATGGGIGSLQAFTDSPPANVDLIAPSGFIDAGDAGIRSSGNLHLAATKILNADNIAVAGISVGAPPPAAPASAPPPAAPPAAAPPAAANTAAAANNSAAEAASKNNTAAQSDDTPSIFSIDILGYGGGDDDEQKKAADASVAPIQASL